MKLTATWVVATVVPLLLSAVAEMTAGPAVFEESVTFAGETTPPVTVSVDVLKVPRLVEISTVPV
jgi:hypothetical protein